MTLEHNLIAVWFIGMIFTAILIGVITCRHEKDRSFAIIVAPLWPVFAIIGSLIGFFWALTEVGAWLGRLYQQKFPS